MAEHQHRRENRVTLVITFGEADEKGVLHPHDDALVVVTMLVTNFTLWRIFVDNSSLANILFERPFAT